MRAVGKASVPTILSVASAALVLAACGGDDSSSATSAADTSSGPAPGLGATRTGDSESNAPSPLEAPNASGATLPRGSAQVELDPAEFTTEIDNPYFPLRPGSKSISKETDTELGTAKIVARVTDKTKVVANGIEAVIARDVVIEDGAAAEIAEDWYAQDRQGNVWHLGGKTKEIKKGKVISSGRTFEAGVDGALPGIAMPAEPAAGLAYREQHYSGEAEDETSIVSVGVEQVGVPAGRYTDVVMTRTVSRVEPKAQELKFFARDVGPVMAISVSPAPAGFEELLRIADGT